MQARGIVRPPLVPDNAPFVPAPVCIGLPTGMVPVAY